MVYLKQNPRSHLEMRGFFILRYSGSMIAAKHPRNKGQ